MRVWAAIRKSAPQASTGDPILSESWSTIPDCHGSQCALAASEREFIAPWGISACPAYRDRCRLAAEAHGGLNFVPGDLAKRPPSSGRPAHGTKPKCQR